MKKVIMRDQTGTEGLLEMIKELGDVSDKTMIEIGSFIGESTIIFAKHFKHVTAIDPFLPNYDPLDPTSNFNFDDVFQEFKNTIEEEKTKVTIYKMMSCDAVGPLGEEKFDFIYIDGLHTYEGVKNDILDYLSFVKKGGVIGGHDYGTPHNHLQGVTKAVDEVLGKPDKTFKDGSWIKFL
jgi:predicted O-methyltransferase YrrM